MRVTDIIEQKLLAGFSPVSLRITDQSHLHAGHGGAREGGESHFLVEMTSEAFADTSALERHRMVNRVLAEELSGPVHALTLRLSPPEPGSPPAGIPPRG